MFHPKHSRQPQSLPLSCAHHLCPNSSDAGSALKALTKSGYHHLPLDLSRPAFSVPFHSHRSPWPAARVNTHSSRQDAPTTSAYAKDKIPSPCVAPSVRPDLASVFSTLSAVRASTGVILASLLLIQKTRSCHVSARSSWDALLHTFTGSPHSLHSYLC